MCPQCRSDVVLRNVSIVSPQRSVGVVSVDATTTASPVSTLFQLANSSLAMLDSRATNLVVAGNLTTQGGLVSATDSYVHLSRSVFARVRLTAGNGGVLAVESSVHCDNPRCATLLSRVVVSDSTLSQCGTENGSGGAVAADNSVLLLQRSSFTNNSVAVSDPLLYNLGFGGALFCSGASTVTVTNSSFSGNQAFSGGSVAMQSTGLLSMASVTMSGECSAGLTRRRFRPDVVCLLRS